MNCQRIAHHLVKRTQLLGIDAQNAVPFNSIHPAHHFAALRGVDARILIPDQADNPLVQYSAWSYFGDLEKVGIKVFRYTKGFMHHKVVLVDDEY